MSPGCHIRAYELVRERHLLGRAVVLLVEAEVLHLPLVIKVLLRIHLQSTKAALSEMWVMCMLMCPRPRNQMSSVPNDLILL